MYYKLTGDYAAEKHETATVIKFDDLTDDQLDARIKAIDGKIN